MMRVLIGLTGLGIVLALAGCNERDQSLNTSAAKSDGQPWQGVQNGFAAPGYQAGDKVRWETQMRQRAQTQNEYVKSN